MKEDLKTQHQWEYHEEELCVPSSAAAASIYELADMGFLFYRQ